MATRTIENPKDRLVTILVAPLMSCSARCPVYLLMIAALVPGDRVPLLTKVGIMLLMYALGHVRRFGFAWLFKRTLLKGAPPLMIMELPPYRLPGLRDVALHMFERGMAVPASRRHRHSRHQHRALVSLRVSESARTARPGSSRWPKVSPAAPATLSSRSSSHWVSTGRSASA